MKNVCMPEEPQIAEIAMRIRDMRDMIGRSVEEMAEITGVTPEEYRVLESGETDFGFTFLYKCAKEFGVDIIDILTGECPHLVDWSYVPAGKGLPINRRVGFDYSHLAPFFKNKLAEPFLVRATFKSEDVEKPIERSTHIGQEFNYVLSGKLRFVHDDHEVEMKEGDSVFYDSSKPHGMIAVDGKDCVFLAVVMKDSEE